VCIDNPAWSNAAYKGEARDISNNGYVVGTNFAYDYPAWTSAYRQNPNGSFTEIPTAPSFPDTWEPLRISEDGKTVVGLIGNPFFGSIPAFWNEGTGTQDLQLFLIAQGLDELYFWYLSVIQDVSADARSWRARLRSRLQSAGVHRRSEEAVGLSRASGTPKTPARWGRVRERRQSPRARRFLGTCDFSSAVCPVRRPSPTAPEEQNVWSIRTGSATMTTLNGPMTPDAPCDRPGASRPQRAHFQIGPRLSTSRVPQLRCE
jgi:hypothetical protein